MGDESKECVPVRPLAWTADSPTVPGDYLYAYRFDPEDEWTQGRMSITERMVREGVEAFNSETLWIGPIPGLPGPAKEGGGT